MTYIILLFAFMAISFLILSYKNYYTIFLSTMVIAIAGMLYSTLNMIYKTGRYSYTTAWGKADYLFLTLTKFSPDYNSIIRMYNIFMAMFMLSIVTFTLLYFNDCRRPRSGKLKFFLIILYILPLLSVWFYDQKVTYYFYIHFISAARPAAYIIYAADICFYLVTFLYAIFPAVFIYGTFKKSSHINRKRAIAVSGSIVIIDIFFLFVILIGFYRKPYIFDKNIIHVVQINNIITPEMYFVIMIISILLVACVLYIISKYSISSKISFFKQRGFRRNLNDINQNYINVFHSVKNIIYSYKILLEKARMQTGKEKEETLAELENKIQDYVNRIAFMLDIENGDLEIEFEPITFEELADMVLQHINSDPNIKIEKCFTTNTKVNIDTFYMTDAVINIINNAADAINKTRGRDGVITLTDDTDGEWSILKISDNGIGMNRREISNLFKPFYTTKSRITNWGIGLSFTYQIIKYHGGYISVESTVGTGTDFYIYLPLVTE